MKALEFALREWANPPMIALQRQFFVRQSTTATTTAALQVTIAGVALLVGVIEELPWRQRRHLPLLQDQINQ